MKDWKQDLGDFFQAQEQHQQQESRQITEKNSEAAEFIAKVVAPAFEEIKAELEKHGKVVSVSADANYDYRAAITVRDGDREEFNFTIRVRVGPNQASPYTEMRFSEGGQRYRGEGSLRSNSGGYSVAAFSKEEIIQQTLSAYKDHMAHRKVR